MLTWDRFNVVRFDAHQLIAITTEKKEFSYTRAQRWILEHEVFSLQIIVLYLMMVFSLKQFMNKRHPFNIDWPIRVWNMTIAILSGFCAVGMTKEFFQTVFGKGINASLCSSNDTFFHGSNGFFLWCYHIIRLFEFTDTLFIILRKQPLLFIHWYHHALTLFVAWFTYARPMAFTRYGIYLNAMVHTVMYSYFFLRSSKIRLPLIIAKSITSAQIVQFIIAFWSTAQATAMKFGLGMPCELDTCGLMWSWFMVSSYLYLFIHFYFNKYSEKKEKHEKCE
ncbi:hypothetical protein PENTCL1PPCAC_17461 [Pristionchus entomophagus]|uniref:Elongation of very long chain fatty acids protein n=1 Tax=Pristionchus entomophagus TaxID=358040 RepID=A0AAV5TLQ9_9BILA|nr:hypothetical protein PENTCL1PPCAC_17461 [Pristionchus entomophagus]